MKYLISGDKHGVYTDFLFRLRDKYPEEELAVIILGDHGCLYYGKKDHDLKVKLQKSGIIFYMLHGNHERRATEIENIIIEYDGEVNNNIYYEADFPNIRYLIDGEIYDFGGYTCLALGGAYSVDKYYRLERGWNWFESEQLTAEEMESISAKVEGLSVDFVLSHTCPYSWMPTDLFLSSINQSTVDNTMEHWMDSLKNTFEWDAWLFAHYHDDRLVRPGVEMFYNSFDDIKDIWYRHLTANYTFMKKDPKFYMEG